MLANSQHASGIAESPDSQRSHVRAETWTSAAAAAAESPAARRHVRIAAGVGAFTVNVSCLAQEPREHPGCGMQSVSFGEGLGNLTVVDCLAVERGGIVRGSRKTHDQPGRSVTRLAADRIDGPPRAPAAVRVTGHRKTVRSQSMA